MGCLSGLKFWRKKSPAAATDPVPRPYDLNNAAAAPRRQHQQFQQPPPYQTPPPQAYDEKARYPLHTSPYASGEKPPLQPPAAHFRQGHGNVSSPQDPIGAGIKEKDEGGVSDPEVERRRKAAEAARLKAEREEQERLDFFQMM